MSATSRRAATSAAAKAVAQRWSWVRPCKPLPFAEFVALMAFLIATVAFSIDAMLPALPAIGAELSPGAPARAQLIITIFALGMGLGTLFSGPISDAIGRKRVLLGGLALYIGGAILAARANSIEALLLARFIQGMGAAGPRVVATAMIRDLFEGRMMARVTSIVMTIFVLVPAFAPSVGAGIVWLADWRAIFLAFVGFALIGALWLGLRQPESLPPEKRRALKISALVAAIREILTNRAVMVYVGALIFAFAPLFVWLSTLPMIFEDVFGRGATFPFWIAGTALIAGSASIVNARLVMRFGMWRLATLAFGCLVVVTLVYAVLSRAGLPAPWDFAAFFVFMCMAFFTIGLTFGNLNALAMRPLGHMAGIGASVVQSLSTIGAVVIAIPIAAAYAGTTGPVVTAMVICGSGALGLMLLARRFSAQD